MPLAFFLLIQALTSGGSTDRLKRLHIRPMMARESASVGDAKLLVESDVLAVGGQIAPGNAVKGARGRSSARGRLPRTLAMRSFISRAALTVKVATTTSSGL